VKASKGTEIVANRTRKTETCHNTYFVLQLY